MAFRTLTFVVRVDDDTDQDFEDYVLNDPRVLLTDDEVMFWGQERGITPQALELGADPSSWDDDEEDDER